MNFRDELKAKVKTPEEINNEQRQERYKELHAGAEECLFNIEKAMKEKVAIAEYTEQNGERIVSVVQTLPFEIHELGEDIIQHEHTDEIIEDIDERPYVYRTHTLSLKKYSDEWLQFYDIMRQIAGKEGIHVEPAVAFQDQDMRYEGEIEYYDPSAFPLSYICESHQYEDGRMAEIAECTLNDIGCKDSDFQLCVKATCVISDQESDDNPIKAQENTEEDTDGKITLDDEKDVISINDLNGTEFERFCADLLTKNGYEDVRKTQDTADQGIDVTATKDGIKYGFQCKIYSGDVGNKAVQEALAGKTFYKCHVGVVLTNSHFTRSAKELANVDGIVLWDEDKLRELITNAGYDVNLD